jgi:hypothetical protein
VKDNRQDGPGEASRGLLADASVLSARGDPSESDLPFGIVQQLLVGVDRRTLARHPLLTGDPAGSSPFAESEVADLVERRLTNA